MTLSIGSVKPVTIETASAGDAVKAYMTLGQFEAYVTTSKGFYDVIAANPAVKKVLADLHAQGNRSVMVSMHGSVYKRGADAPGYRVTSLTPVADTLSASGIVARAGKYFVEVKGKSVELKPMTKDATQMVKVAAHVRPSSVTGAMNGDKLEVWGVAIAMRTFPIRPAPVSV